MEYSKAKDEMFRHTDTAQSPWFVVNADIKKHARLNCITHILDQIPYEDITPAPIELPPMVKDPHYVRPPIQSMHWIPAKFGNNPIDDDRSWIVSFDPEDVYLLSPRLYSRFISSINFSLLTI